MDRVGGRQGFTIVELLIVIVVIAILAAITIVAYNGIQNRARASEAQSNLSSAYKKIKSYAITANEQYPSSVTACPSPSSTELCFSAANSQSVISYSVNNTASPGSFCMDFVRGSIAYYVDTAGQVLPGSCGLRSCYEIQQAGGSHGSGTYWIKPTGAPNSIRAYCDMDTSGGGWTLVINNVGPPATWNASTSYNLNPGEPSLMQSYSVVQYADDIKANLSNRLNYRIEATTDPLPGTLGQRGGVWSAPYSATLEGVSPQNVATLDTKYETPPWAYDSDPSDSNGTQSPSTVVPWFSSTYNGFVTWGGTGNWWGTIMTSQLGWLPTAPYISSQPNPTAIRYWVK